MRLCGECLYLTLGLDDVFLFFICISDIICGKMKDNLTFDRKFGFEVWEEGRIKKAFEFAEGYKNFISKCKTEREVVDWVVERARSEGYTELESTRSTKGIKSITGITGRGVYSVNRGKSIILGVFGKKPMRDGVKMILAHIDSPRIDLKPTPLYESERVAWFKTQYYGGIKKYQWPTIPLAIHGVVVLANGKKIEIVMGEKENEPVLTITDLLPHLSEKQMEKKLEEAVEGEEMNVVIGSRPIMNSKLNPSTSLRTRTQNSKLGGEKNSIKLGILELLNERYGITEEDLVSADLEIVPAGQARDLGFDSSMIGGYGQDDRVCAYSAVQGLLSIKDPQTTNIVVLTDKEETGSESNTGALSNFIPDFISEMLYLQEGKHDENLLRDCLSTSKAISADVTVAFDPDYKDVFDPLNTARLGAGITIEKYTGRKGKSSTSEASAEYIAEIRNVFNKNNILWQTGGLGKVDIGGGGTIAMFLARYNMDVVDAGPPILSMHSPFEISSKIDIFACFEAYKAFFNLIR